MKIEKLTFKVPLPSKQRARLQRERAIGSLHLLQPIQKKNKNKNKNPFHFFHQPKHSNSAPSCLCCIGDVPLGPPAGFRASFHWRFASKSPHWVGINTLLACSRLCMSLVLSSLPELCRVAIRLHNQRTRQHNPTICWEAVSTGTT